MATRLAKQDDDDEEKVEKRKQKRMEVSPFSTAYLPKMWCKTIKKIVGHPPDHCLIPLPDYAFIVFRFLRLTNMFTIQIF